MRRTPVAERYLLDRHLEITLNKVLILFHLTNGMWSDTVPDLASVSRVNVLSKTSRSSGSIPGTLPSPSSTEPGASYRLALRQDPRLACFR